MKKTYLIFTLLIAFAFLAACTKQTDTANCIPKESLSEVCKSYCTASSVPEAPVAPSEPPAIVPPSVTPDRTSFLDPIPNVGNAIIDREKNSVIITFKNNKGVPITLPLTGSVGKYSASECKNPQITATYKGEKVEALITTIPNGDEFTVTWDCENLENIPAAGTAFSADLKFHYKIESGMIAEELGTVVGKY